MDFLIISNAARFVYSQMSSRTWTWFKLAFLTSLMVSFALMISVIPFGMAVLSFFPNTESVISFMSRIQLPGMSLVGVAVWAMILLFMVYIGFYINITFGSIPARNVLDHFEKKKLRMFEDRIATHKLALVMLFYVAAVIVGTMLFIIPGVVIAVHYRYAYWVMLDKKCTVFEAFSKSWELTEDKFWQLLIATMIANVIDSLRMITVIFPVTSLFEGSIYYQLKTAKNKK